MTINKYHKYHSLATMQLCQKVWGSGGRAPNTIRLLHLHLQNHRKPMKTMQWHINVPNVREGSAAERKPVNPPVTSGNQACLERILSISINLWKRGGLPPPSPSGSRRTLSPGPPSTIISYINRHSRNSWFLLYVLANIEYFAKKKLPEIHFLLLKRRLKSLIFALGPS